MESSNENIAPINDPLFEKAGIQFKDILNGTALANAKTGGLVSNSLGQNEEGRPREERIKARKEHRFWNYLSLRYSYSDNLHKEKKRGIGAKNKGGKNWWQSLIAQLDIDIAYGLINEEELPEVFNFMGKYKSNKVGTLKSTPTNAVGKMTKREQIIEADTILNSVIEHIIKTNEMNDTLGSKDE